MFVNALRILVALVIAVFGVSTAEISAHADLERSSPEAGSSLETAPDRIELWFSEELAEGSTAQVVGPGGIRVDNNDGAVDLYDPERKHLVVTLAGGLPAGEYTVNWTTLSGEDDDTHTGSFTFVVTTGSIPLASPIASPLASPVASPVASPQANAESAHTLGQVEISEDPASPNARALAIAIGVGLLAALGIYLFWLLVKPRK